MSSQTYHEMKEGNDNGAKKSSRNFNSWVRNECTSHLRRSRSSKRHNGHVGMGASQESANAAIVGAKFVAPFANTGEA